MSTDNVKYEEKTKIGITWNALIQESESEIRSCREKIAKLRKSVVFFKKQLESDVAFPIQGARNGRRSK